MFSGGNGGAGGSTAAGFVGAGAGSSSTGIGFGGDSVGAGGGADMPVPPSACSGSSSCTDFPTAPIMDGTPPGNAASLFPASGTFTGTLCVAEPQLSAGSSPGALMPANWTRPRFRMTPANGENLFEIRISAKGESGELVVYTTNTTWALPATIWKGMGAQGNAVDQPITVTIRGVNTASPGTPTGATGTFTIAPVTAGGSMVYWATNSSDVMPNTSKLVGFYVGDETTIDALTIAGTSDGVQQTGILAEDGNELRGMYSPPYGVAPGHTQCIGCHVSTPDGNAVGFTDEWPWPSVFANIATKSGAIGSVPSWETAGAQRLTQQPWMGMMTMTAAHWASNDRIALIAYENRSTMGWNSTDPDTSGFSGQDKLAWFSMDTTVSIPWTMNGVGTLNSAVTSAQGTAWGFLTLQGETAGVVSPNWSHDGKNIVYTSATQTQDGRIGDNAETDIHMVPYGDKAGGTVTPVAGAATPGVSEYYPSFSADDKFIAFNRAANTTGKIYYRPDGEVYVILAAGGTPTRLAANDPPACTGKTSPGMTNSWPKWSPTVVTNPNDNGNTYYWLIFSSARDYPGKFIVPPNQYSPSDTRSSQLYMAGIVVDKQGNAHTFPAVYVWTQVSADANGGPWSNLTPAWNQFNIPPPPPPT